MRKWIEFAATHSMLVNLVTLFIVVAGVMSLKSMGREAFPNINYDVVTVQTGYFGAPAQEIEKLITIKLEDEIKEVDGIDEILSVSSENISMIVLKLDPDDKDKQKIVNDIQRAVDRAQNLPADLEDDPLVTEIESRNFPVISVSMSGDLTEEELQREAKVLETRLLDIPGVARIARVGWRDREIWVDVLPRFIDEYKMSLEDVIEALASQNLNLPGGTLDPPGEREYLVRTMGEFQTLDEIRKVVIRANDQGNWIRIEDVAEVSEAFEDNDILEKTRGTKAINLTVVKKESADIINIVKTVKEAVTAYQTTAPTELKVSYFEDMSFYVKRRLNVLVSNGKIGIVLVLISLLIFLTRSVAIMTALGIPLALFTTFFLMNVLGISINLITMFALIMVLGIIVDDAIVIAENVYRHVEAGMPPREAAIKGTLEVAKPLVSTVLTTIAAFVPIFFMEGIMGKFCSVIPLVVIVALSASLFESLFILPSHLADFIRSKRRRAQHKTFFDHHFQQFRIGYLRTLRWVIHHRYFALVIVIGVFIASGILFKTQMRFVLFPQGLIEQFFIRTEAPIGTSLKDNALLLAEIETFVHEIPDVELDNFITQVGLQREDPSDPSANRGSHIGQIHVFLTPDKDRTRTADEIITELRKKVEPVKDTFATISFEKVRAGPPVGKPISIRLKGEDLSRLKLAALDITAVLQKLTGTSDVKDDYEAGKDEWRVLVDSDKARKAYLTVRDIAGTVRNAIEGKVATTIQEADEEIDVLVRYPEAHRNSREVFDNLYVPNRLGNLIPVDKVARFETVSGIRSIKRLDRKRMIQVTGNVDEDVLSALEVKQAVETAWTKKLHHNYPDVILVYGGEQEETQKSLSGFFSAFILALFLIFIILAYNFNSILQPLVVMLAIPFGLVGVIFAFYLHGKPLSFMALLGMIGLSGVVVNDSIILVDFINTHLKKGWSRAHAVFGAGRLRLRPVLLTSISTVLGLMPVAYGIGGGDPFVMPMALAIGWGLFFATALTLLVIPCVYMIMADLATKLRGLTK